MKIVSNSSKIGSKEDVINIKDMFGGFSINSQLWIKDVHIFLLTYDLFLNYTCDAVSIVHCTLKTVVAKNVISKLPDWVKHINSFNITYECGG